MPVTNTTTRCTTHAAMQPDECIHQLEIDCQGQRNSTPAEISTAEYRHERVRVCSLDAREAKADGKSFDILPQYFDIRTVWNSKFKVFQLLALFSPNLKANLNHPAH